MYKFLKINKKHYIFKEKKIKNIVIMSQLDTKG